MEKKSYSSDKSTDCYKVFEFMKDYLKVMDLTCQ